MLLTDCKIKQNAKTTALNLKYYGSFNVQTIAQNK